MKTSEILLGRAEDKGLVKKRDNYLSLAPKNEQGVPTPNGKHRIVLVSDKITKTSEGVEQLTVTVKEGGAEKLWNIKLWNINQNTGEKTLHYLVQTLADYKEGDELIVEMKKNGTKNYVDVKKVVTSTDGESVKVIQLDEDGTGDTEKLPPLTPEEEDIDPANIPL